MKILFVSAECAPFAKTGGLGDVSAALPRYLAQRGHDVRVVLPLYAKVREKHRGFQPVFQDLSVQLGPRRILRARRHRARQRHFPSTLRDPQNNTAH